MSNAHLRSKNVEVGIRVLTKMVLLKNLGTWYFVLGTLFLILKRIYTWYFACLPQAGTWYFVQKKEADRKISLFFRSVFD
jgi:hypothetical protein